MMKQHTSLSACGDKVVFSVNRKERIAFREYREMECTGRAVTFPDVFHAISVGREVYEAYRHEKMLLLKEGSGAHVNVQLMLNEKLAAGEFRSTSFVREKLGIQTGDRAYLCRYDSRVYGKILTQKIDHIRENNLVVSALDSRGEKMDVQHFRHFEVFSPLTGGSMIVRASHIVVDEKLAPGTLRLNRKQRIFMGLEFPFFLTREQWARLNGALDEAQRDALSQVYVTEEHLLNKDASYEQKKLCRELFKEHFGRQIRIIPVLESVSAGKKGLGEKLCDFFVGKSTISLIAKRPFENDEGLDVVRMTRSNMHLLGIDEMDKVQVQYRSRKVSCRVLELDGNEEAFLETNRPMSMDFAIGIPSHIRKKLDLPDLATAVKVDRDTRFIFKKSINEQVVPIILTLFSANLFTDSSVILSALLSLFAVPLVLYLNLSSKRNMRG